MLTQSVSCAAPGARALYLGARDHKKITCTAEALVVQNSLRQTRRYPLDRLSRVVSSTVADWSGEALALCLSRGITITWMDGKGQALGSCHPTHRRLPRHAAAVELLTESAEGMEKFVHWHRARRLEVLMRWAEQTAHSISPLTWEATKRTWVYGQRFDVHLPLALREHTLAWVEAQLAGQGLPPVLWDPEAKPIALDQLLCDLLWAEMNLCTGTLADSETAQDTATTLFERWMARHGGALTLHITSLCRTAMKAL